MHNFSISCSNFNFQLGTGKTVLLRGNKPLYTNVYVNKLNLLLAIISKMKTIYKTGEIAVTASTGLAAANIQGSTIHR